MSASPISTPTPASPSPACWKQDPKHGWQFQAIDYRTTLPATVQGMRRYLGSGLVKGIGPVTAGRLVDHREGVDEQVERLTEVPEIGPVRAARIAATWEEQRHIREVMAALQDAVEWAQGRGFPRRIALRRAT